MDLAQIPQLKMKHSKKGTAVTPFFQNYRLIQNMRSMLTLISGNTEIRNLLHRNFGSFCRIFDAYDPTEALTWLEKEDIDLVVLDLPSWGEPDEDLLRSLKGRHGEMGVVVITENGKASEVRRDFPFGTADYISNPMVPSLFLTTITKALEKIVFIQKINSISEEIRNLNSRDPGEYFPDFRPWAQMIYSPPKRL